MLEHTRGMYQGQFTMNTDLQLESSKPNERVTDQNSVNFAKVMMLGILDPNIAALNNALQKAVNANLGEKKLSELNLKLQGELQSLFDNIKKSETEVATLIQNNAEAIGIYNPKNSILDNVLMPKGYKIARNIQEVLQEGATFKDALENLTNAIAQNRAGYVNQYNQHDAHRMRIIYGDHVINKSATNNKNQINVENGIVEISLNKNSEQKIQTIMDIPELNLQQKDFITQLCSQTNLATLGNQEKYVASGHEHKNVAFIQPYVQGLFVEIEKKEDGKILFNLYSNTAFIGPEGSQAPISITKITVDLTDIGRYDKEKEEENSQITLVSNVSPIVSVTSCYFRDKHEITGTPLMPINDDFLAIPKRFFEIQSKGWKFTGEDTKALNPVTEIQNIFNMEYESFITDLEEKAANGIIRQVKVDLKKSEYLKQELPRLKAMLPTNDIVSSSAFEFMMNDIKHGNLAQITQLVSTDNANKIDLEKTIESTKQPKYEAQAELCSNLLNIVTEHKKESPQKQENLLTEIEKATVDTFSKLCKTEKQQNILSRNTRQFARECLYEAGELKFKEHPIEILIMFINNVYAAIFGNQLENTLNINNKDFASSFSKRVTKEKITEKKQDKHNIGH